MNETAALPHLAKGNVSKKLGINGLTERQSAFCWIWMFGDPGIRHNTQVCYGLAFGWIDQPDDEMAQRKAWLAHDYGNRLLQTPKISAQIERYRTQLMMQTDLARPSWVADALKMRNDALEHKNFAAARAFHRDIGEALGHFTTRIEVTHAERSSDVMAELAEHLAQYPELADTPEMKQIESITRPISQELTNDDPEFQLDTLSDD